MLTIKYIENRKPFIEYHFDGRILVLIIFVPGKRLPVTVYTKNYMSVMFVLFCLFCFFHSSKIRLYQCPFSRQRPINSLPILENYDVIHAINPCLIIVRTFHIFSCLI